MAYLLTYSITKWLTYLLFITLKRILIKETQEPQISKNFENFVLSKMPRKSKNKFAENIKMQQLKIIQKK